MYIDTHTHFDLILEDKSLTEEMLLNTLKLKEVEFAVQIAIDVKSSLWSYDFASKHRSKGVLFTLGIHPSNPADQKEINDLSDCLKKVKPDDLNLLFGVGECGLDFYRLHQPKEKQIESFEAQIDLAKKNNLPLIIHSREAMSETIDILKEKKVNAGIMHCFAGDREVAKKVLDLGLYISFAGNLTYKKAFTLVDSAAYVPLDRLFLETDAPFLTPVPFRGQKNRSEYVREVYKFVANLKNESLSKVLDQIQQNFISFRRRGG